MALLKVTLTVNPVLGKPIAPLAGVDAVTVAGVTFRGVVGVVSIG